MTNKVVDIGTATTPGLDRQQTGDTLRIYMVMAEYGATTIRESSVMTLVFGIITMSITTAGGFFALLHSSWIPDSMRVWTPLGYFFGMIVIVAGALFLEEKWRSLARYAAQCVDYEQQLRALGAQVREWKYINQRGESIVAKTPAITKSGAVLFVAWVLWSLPQAITVYRTLNFVSATGMIAGVFVAGWILSMLVNVVHNDHHGGNIRFGYRVWVVLMFVTLSGAGLVVLHEHFNLLRELIPGLVFRQ